MRSKRSQSGLRSGFTLVELLVVIGIVALLVSIMLPSIGKARESANRVKCASNLRQIAIGASMYANRNQGRLPRTYHKPGAGLLNSTKGGPNNAPSPNSFDRVAPESPVGASNVGASLYLLLREGFITAEIVRCPSNVVAETLDQTKINDFANFPAPLRNFNSYSYIAQFPNAKAIASGWRYSLSLSPDYPLASDLNPGKGGKNFTNSDVQDVTSVKYDDSPKNMARANSNNHRNQGQQVVYVDAHVEWQTSPFCGPIKAGRAWRDNIFANTNGVDEASGLGGKVHAQPQEQTDIVLHPGDGAN